MRFIFSLLFALCATIISVPLAAADEYPSHTVRIVVPYGPGGVSDIAARLLGVKLAEYWKQAVVIDNRAGGGGTIGTGIVAKSASDGYTLLLATVSEFAIAQHLYPKRNLNPLKEFAPVVLVSDNPVVFAAHAGAPFNTLREMMAYANAQPGGLAYGTPGVGTLNHLMAERFVFLTKTKMLHVPYKGGGPAGAALAGGEVQLGLLAASSVGPYVRSDRAKVIAVVGPKRLASAPEWPTVAESGVAGFDGTNWTALVAPAGTPRDIIAKINADANRALRAADTRERFTAAGSEAVGSTVEELAARMRADSDTYAKLIQDMKIEME